MSEKRAQLLRKPLGIPCFYNQAEELVRNSNVREDSTATQITIRNQMFPQSNRRAGKSLYCQGRPYRFSDNDCKANFLQSSRRAGNALYCQGRKFTASEVRITKQMFLQSSRRAANSLQCLWREYNLSDNNYKENVSTIKQKSWKVSLLSSKRLHGPT